MTYEELAEEYAEGHSPSFKEFPKAPRGDLKEAFLAGLKAGKEYYSKIYMQGRKDERERPCSLCKNPGSICIRCDCYKTLCEGSDTGAYIGACKDFIYKEVKEND